MKEKEFIKELKELNLFNGLDINVYWYLDDKQDILIDFDSMKEEFNNKLKEIEEVLK
jgi:hypothetical protein